VKFGCSAAKFPDIRILEYGGINAASPLDVAAGTTNNSTASSVSLTTKNATDLLVGAVQTSTTGPGSGFTRRLLTNPDGDLAKDRTTTAIGSYTASAPLNAPGAGVMQMVAFRSASTDPGRGRCEISQISSLTSGFTYYFAMTAYNSAGVDGPYSSQISYSVP
jgi:hypothetical protein